MTYATSSIYNTLFNKSYMTGGSNLFNLFIEKKTFLFKVFLNLIIQLAITYFIMTKTHFNINHWIILGLNIFVLLIIIFIPMHPLFKTLLFTIFSISTGIMLSYSNIDKNTLSFAVIGTAAIFVSMLFSGVLLLALGIEFGAITFFILFVLLLLLLLLYFINSLLNLNQSFLSYFGIVLFSFFIIVDTQHILKRNYYGDFITASLDYYLDIINLFIRLANLKKN